ncbi:MAG TPA: PRC-barrel domain-containing protein [Mycobacteriales bacterium]|nr:PRC-barrel domain-containing protein [Mycobacteriales bacterium]
MRFSEAKNRKVVSTAEAETVGRVRDLVLDARSRTVVALALRKTAGDGDILPWAEMKSFGQDAITVHGPERIVKAEGELAVLADKDHRVLGKRVLTDRGDEVGSVSDIEFDPESGTVRALLLGKEEISGERLHAIGSYAVIVQR